MSKIRNSNIELLRIIAMILIIAHHYSVHGIFDFNSNFLSFNECWIQFLSMGGKVGVNIFILISGYFLITSKQFKLQKVVKLILQLFFYSILIYFIFLMMGQNKFNLNVFFPITYQTWWFASTYFVLYILSPFINKFLLSLNRNEYKKLLLIMFTIWCIIPTIFEENYESNSLIWFIFLYALSGYIRLHGIKIQKDFLDYMKLTAIGVFINFILFIFLEILDACFPYIGIHTTRFFAMNTLPILLISLTLFLGFIHLNIGYVHFINVISSTTFGIYLIHDHPLVRALLWKDLFYNPDSSYLMLVLYSIFVVLIVFVGCMLIERIRLNVIDNRLTKLYNFIENKTSRFICFVESKL